MQKQESTQEVINRIIDAVRCSPTGSGRMATGVIVIDNPKILEKLSDLLYDAYEGLGKALKNPIARIMIKKKKGKNKLLTLQNFVMPGMQWYIQWYREEKSNEILRDCPALILFHSPVNEPVGAENCLIAAFHAILMAQVMNIGTCFNDLIPPMCNRVREIRDLLGLSNDREVYAGLTMGYPKYKFKRTIPRKLAEVNYLE
ncbi:nitroreductase family protein [candidate division KSB1 bacterium]